MKNHLNLIPLATQRLYARKRVLRFWSTIITVAGIVCLTACGIEWGRGLAAAQKLKAYETRFAPLAKLVEEKRELLQLVSNLRGREKISLELSSETKGVALLGAVSKAASERGGDVYISKFEYEGSSQSGRKKKGSHRRLHLGGAGADSLAVAAFVAGLRDSGLFDSVTVDSSRPLRGGGPTLRSFEINCLF